VNVASNWSGGTSDINSYTCQTVIHEILHGLGLGHAGNYNGTANFVTDTTNPIQGNNSNVARNDSWQMSIMSYFGQNQNTELAADRAYVMTTMAAVEGLRIRYGATSDTVHGVGTSIAADISTVLANLASYASVTAFTIVDDGGYDTIGFFNLGDNQLIDIRVIEVCNAQDFNALTSNIGGLTGNMTLAVGAVVEEVRSGSGHDTIFGNDFRNGIYAGSGDDQIYGDGGDEYIRAGSGDDFPSGGDGDDILRGDAGDDLLTGLGGADTLRAGDGKDTPVGGGGSDRLEGGGGNDLLTGSTGNDVIVFRNGFGKDVITDFSASNSEKIDLSAVPAITSFWGLVNNHLQTDTQTGFALIAAAKSILLQGISTGQIGTGLDY